MTVTMDTLHVARLRARYHLPTAARDERERLDRVLRTMLDDALALALERAGIDPREEICIRHLHARTRLRLAGTDAALGAEWSVSLADAIRDAIDGGGAGVVRYASRRHALVDLVRGAVRGDLARAWAWRQLGLWSPSDDETARGASVAAVRALLADARAIPSVLEAAATDAAFARWAADVEVADCRALANAALDAAGADPRWLVRSAAGRAAERESVDEDRRDEGRGITGDRQEAPAIDQATRLAARILRHSALGAVLPALDGGRRHALAIIAALAAEPSALSGHDAGGRALVNALGAVGPSPSRRDPDAAEPPATIARREVGVRRDAADRSPNRADRRADQADANVDVGDDGQRLDDAEPGLASAPELLGDDRARGRSRAGGLLFLLHLVADLDLPVELRTAAPLAARSLRWTLNRLAQRLAPVDALDAAALAFAGLPPTARDPFSGEPEPDEAERAAIDALARRVTRALHVRMAAGDEPPERLLRRIVARDVEIVADPGWIEAHYDLRDVSTEIRRAALDLDLDYLPWLGVVVRFHYA